LTGILSALKEKGAEKDMFRHISKIVITAAIVLVSTAVSSYAAISITSAVSIKEAAIQQVRRLQLLLTLPIHKAGQKWKLWLLRQRIQLLTGTAIQPRMMMK